MFPIELLEFFQDLILVYQRSHFNNTLQWIDIGYIWTINFLNFYKLGTKANIPIQSALPKNLINLTDRERILTIQFETNEVHSRYLGGQQKPPSKLKYFKLNFVLLVLKNKSEIALRYTESLIAKNENFIFNLICCNLNITSYIRSS